MYGNPMKIRIPNRIQLMCRYLVPVILTFCLSATNTRAQPPDIPNPAPWAAVGTEYMVACDHPLASEAGARILAVGGNAFDAAVAVSFALGVVRPYSTGIGGGGFALLMKPGERPVVVDFRERAPVACTPERYLDQNGDPIADLTVRGPWAVGVPGTLKGAAHILENFGTMTLADVIQPALELAGNGFPVDAHTHKAMKSMANIMQRHPDYPTRYAELYETFLRDGEPFAIGDTLRRPRLAETLRLVASAGPDALYAADGDLHNTLIEYMRRTGGPMTASDLTGYEIVLREPLAGHFMGYEIWTMPPPSSGGAVITAVLNAVERFAVAVPDERLREHAWPHFLVECFKHAFADRARGLGDWDFDSTGAIHRLVERMIDTTTAGQLVGNFDPEKTRDPETYGASQLPDDRGTSHFCVIDADGRAVAWTETINLEFGSFDMIPGTGIVLNNELDDFAITSTAANRYGLFQSDHNLIGPGKRPLSSMAPTIVTAAGRPVLLVGGSGGPRIITGSLHVILNSLRFGMRADSAVAAPRFHHQWRPDVVRVERNLDGAIVAGLVQHGHTVKLYRSSPGIIQVVDCRNGLLFGASDPRKGGKPAGR